MVSFPPAVTHTLSGAHDPDGPQDPPIRLAVHELGESTPGRPPVILAHGFPELAYSWRYQLPALADAGFRAVAPDQRGYGASSAPEAIEAYGLGQLCGDLADLLDALEVDQAVFAGHDWGGFVTWAMAVLHPERTAGVIGLCTPYTPFPTTDFLRAMFGEDEKMYMLWFQEPGVAEAELDPRAELVFDKLMRTGVDPAVLLERRMGRAEGLDFNPFKDLEGLGEMGDPVAGEEELAHYAEVYSRTGFRGGINWYRNIDANDARYDQVGRAHLDIPCLMITSEWDPALPPALAAGMGDLCSDLEMHMVSRTGHWLPQESPEEVNALMTDWLVRRFG